MKVCSKCGMDAPDELVKCKKCGGELLQMPEQSEGSDPQKRRKDWIFLLIAIPLLLLVLRFGISALTGAVS